MENIIELTHDNTNGFYSGPLYLKQLNPDLLLSADNLKIEKIQPAWMPNDNEFYKIEKEGQMANLKTVVERHNKFLFDRAAEAIKYLKTNENQ